MPLAFLIAALFAPSAEQPDLRTVMSRAGAYVARYQQDFSLLLADTLAQARAIAFASARYNIGDVVRTVNVPTLADERLQMWVQARMTERYEAESRTITGEATHTNFRRFETELKLLGVK